MLGKPGTHDAMLSLFSTWRLYSRDAKRKQESGNVIKIGWRKNSPRTSMKRSYFFVCSREQSRQVDNRLYSADFNRFTCRLPDFNRLTLIDKNWAYIKFNGILHDDKGRQGQDSFPSNPLQNCAIQTACIYHLSLGCVFVIKFDGRFGHGFYSIPGWNLCTPRRRSSARRGV